MGPAGSRAVFLSYASQDVEAARRIADALRAFGMQVWFDKHELRGGDAWDQKIRRQIHDCALFLPVISTTTQQRGEGYFRREWLLAVERTRDMAEGVPFVVPVVVDDIPETSAAVPEQFLRVQWTRLPHGVPLPQFVEQVQRLLEAPRTPPAARLAQVSNQPHLSAPLPAAVARRSGVRGWAWGALAAVVAVGLVAWLTNRQSEPPAAPPKAVAAAKPKAVAPAASDKSAPADKSIAVLPFENMSEDPANAFFCDGLHDDVITALWKIRNLKVISRGSVLEYKDRRRNLRQIATELSVTHLLEGSVRRAGDQLRVTAQLIDGRTDQHLWAETYNRTVKDAFAIQAEIAGEVARALTASLSPEDKRAISRAPTQNQEAYDLYLKARTRNPSGKMQSRPAEREAMLMQAVELDPKFLVAWCELTRVRSSNLFDYLETPAERPAKMEAARTAMERASALQVDAPETALARGYYYFWAQRDFERALTEFSSAARRLPNDAEIDYALGHLQSRLGRFREAAVFLEKALERDPRNSDPLSQLPLTYRYLRDGRSADEAYARALKVSPNYFYLGLERAYSAFVLLNDDTAFARFLDSVPPERDKNGQVSRARFDWLLWNRQFTEARQLLEARKDVMYPTGKVFERERDYGYLSWLTNQHDELRRHGEALRVAVNGIPEGNKVKDRLVRMAWMAVGEAALGRTEVALGLLRQLEDEMTRERWMHDTILRSSFDWALMNVYLVLARHEEAMDIIEQLLAKPSYMTVRLLQTHPFYDQLRSLPRFQKLVGAGPTGSSR